MAFIPLPQSIDMQAKAGTKRDRFGNLVAAPGEWRQVRVASWWVDRSEEKAGDSVLRTVDYLHVHCLPSDAPGPEGRVRTPDGRVWSVTGNPEDFNHGFHGFIPGLVIVHAKEVQG